MRELAAQTTPVGENAVRALHRRIVARSEFDFLKRTTWVQADAEALGRIGPAGVTLAEAEGLQAHARSIALRLR